MIQITRIVKPVVFAVTLLSYVGHGRDLQGEINAAIETAAFKDDSSELARLYAQPEVIDFLKSRLDIVRRWDVAFRSLMARKPFEDIPGTKFFKFWGNAFRSHPSFRAIADAGKEQMYEGISFSETFFAFDETFATAIREAKKQRDDFALGHLADFNFDGFPRAKAEYGEQKPIAAPTRSYSLAPVQRAPRKTVWEQLQSRKAQVAKRESVAPDDIALTDNLMLTDILASVDDRLVRAKGRLGTVKDEELLLTAFEFLIPYFDGEIRRVIPFRLPDFQSPILKALAVHAATQGSSRLNASERLQQRAHYFRSFTPQDWRIMGENFFVFGLGEELRDLRYDILRLGGEAALRGLLYSLESKAPRKVRAFFRQVTFGQNHNHEKALDRLENWRKVGDVLDIETLQFLLVPGRRTLLEKEAAAVLNNTIGVRITCEGNSA